MIISPTLHTAGLAGVEMAINKALSLDPGSRQQLLALDDHVFHIQLNQPRVDFFLIPTEHSIRLCGNWESQVDTCLSGSLGDFLQVAGASDPANALINGKLSLTGNSQALITLQNIVKNLELDWETLITKRFGDVIGHQMTRGIRGGLRFAKQGVSSLQRQFKEYLSEESQLQPAPYELEQFYHDIDTLQQRSERLAAKIAKLETTTASEAR